MTRRLFVCHATADIEATSELVDALENALNFSTGSLWTSSLPGYCADPNDMPALGAALAGSDVVLAVVTKTSVQDAQFHFQLGAAWALGAHTVLFMLDPAAQEALPNALSQASVMRGHEPSQWSELIGDLSVRLGLVPRPSSAPAIPLASLPPAAKSAPPVPAAAPASAETPPETATTAASPAAEPPKRADETPLPAAVAKIANASARSPASATTSTVSAAPSQPSAAKPVSVPPLPRSPSAPPLTTPVTRSAGVPPLPAAVTSQSVIVPPPPSADDGEPTTTPKAPIIVLSTVPSQPQASEPEPDQLAPGEPQPEPKPQPRAAGSYPSVAPQHSYLDELRAIGSDPEERTPPRYSYVDELDAIDPEEHAAAASGYEALTPDDEPADDDEPETREQLRVPSREDEAAPADAASDSDVFARLPTCEMALEAGRAVSDCLFNRDEIDNFASELDGPLGSLIESLGASWTELRAEQDLDTWVAVTDHLLQTLPDEVRKLEEWYRVGFELATLHNLAGQLVLDGSDAAAEQHWRSALERFLMRAERAEIGYENLGRVLGLLENLVGPSHERDLSNIPRSLEELRRYAAGADIHTAA